MTCAPGARQSAESRGQHSRDDVGVLLLGDGEGAQQLLVSPARVLRVGIWARIVAPLPPVS
jgi:hypothetical protein